MSFRACVVVHPNNAKLVGIKFFRYKEVVTNFAQFFRLLLLHMIFYCNYCMRLYDFSSIMMMMTTTMIQAIFLAVGLLV